MSTATCSFCYYENCVRSVLYKYTNILLIFLIKTLTGNKKRLSNIKLAFAYYCYCQDTP